MQPTPPFWFRQRQGKMENLDDNTLRLTAPNMIEGVIRVRHEENGQWAGALLASATGPELASTPPIYATPQEAWDAAFELHRRRNVV
jgi:hypothetical protein